MVSDTLTQRLVLLEQAPELVRAFIEKATRDNLPIPTLVQIAERIDVPALQDEQ